MASRAPKPGAGAKAGPPSAEDFTEAIGSANERLREVLEAADRAAREILDEARAESRRYVAQERDRARKLTKEKLTRLAEMADEMTAQTDLVRQRLAEFAQTVEAATRSLSSELAIEDQLEPSVDGPAAPADSGPSEDDGAAPDGNDEQPVLRRMSLFRGRRGSAEAVGSDRSEEIRARVAQWRSWGMSHRRIEARLADEFRVKNPGAVLESLERSRRGR